MQKSKTSTIAMAAFIFVYIYISQTFLYKLGNIYLYIINPVFFIAVAFFLKSFLLPMYTRRKFQKDTIQYTVIAVLIYIIVYLLSGLFVGFGKNPYAIGIRGFFINIWVTGTVILSREYIRCKLINNVFEKDKKSIAIILIIIFSLMEFNIFQVFNGSLGGYDIFKQFFYKLLPIVIKNILFSYIVINTDYISCVMYEMLINIFLWVSPILPTPPWVMISIIDSIIPLMLLLYLRYAVKKRTAFVSKKEKEESNPIRIVPFAIFLIVTIWFALGMFPIKPTGIATGSMKPEIDPGDVVIIKKAKPNDIKVNDIIEYSMDDYTVIHRVIEIKQEKGEYYFITKGDNNRKADFYPVKEDQLIGKVIFKIKYLALPTLWIRNVDYEDIEVETGTNL